MSPDTKALLSTGNRCLVSPVVKITASWVQNCILYDFFPLAGKSRDGDLTVTGYLWDFCQNYKKTLIYGASYECYCSRPLLSPVVLITAC